MKWTYSTREMTYLAKNQQEDAQAVDPIWTKTTSGEDNRSEQISISNKKALITWVYNRR